MPSSATGPSVPFVLVLGGAGFGKTTAVSQWLRQDKRSTAWLTATAAARRSRRAPRRSGPAPRRVRAARTSRPTAAVGRIRRLQQRDAPSPGRRRECARSTIRTGDRRRAPASAPSELASAADAGGQCSRRLTGRADLPDGAQIGARSDANRSPCAYGNNTSAGTGPGREPRRSPTCPVSGSRRTSSTSSGSGPRAGRWRSTSSPLHCARRHRRIESKPRPRFAGDDRLIVEYVREEVLDTLPRRLRTFLLHVSILDELNADACDAILERLDSARVLEDAAHSMPLLTPIDRSEQVVPDASTLAGQSPLGPLQAGSRARCAAARARRSLVRVGGPARSRGATPATDRRSRCSRRGHLARRHPCSWRPGALRQSDDGSSPSAPSNEQRGQCWRSPRLGASHRRRHAVPRLLDIGRQRHGRAPDAPGRKPRGRGRGIAPRRRRRGRRRPHPCRRRTRLRAGSRFGARFERSPGISRARRSVSRDGGTRRSRDWMRRRNSPYRFLRPSHSALPNVPPSRSMRTTSTARTSSSINIPRWSTKSASANAPHREWVSPSLPTCAPAPAMRQRRETAAKHASFLISMLTTVAPWVSIDARIFLARTLLLLGDVQPRSRGGP